MKNETVDYLIDRKLDWILPFIPFLLIMDSLIVNYFRFEQENFPRFRSNMDLRGRVMTTVILLLLFIILTRKNLILEACFFLFSSWFSLYILFSPNFNNYIERAIIDEFLKAQCYLWLKIHTIIVLALCGILWFIVRIFKSKNMYSVKER